MAGEKNQCTDIDSHPHPPTGNTHHAPLFTINVLKVLVSRP